MKKILLMLIVLNTSIVSAEGQYYQKNFGAGNMKINVIKNEENNLSEKSITNELANNLNKDININYFDVSEQSVLFNTYINESSIGFDVNDEENVKGRLRSTGVAKVNNMWASQINIEELFIGIHQRKIKKIIIENAIGEKQEYYNLKFKNINNEYFEISGDYDNLKANFYKKGSFR